MNKDKQKHWRQMGGGLSDNAPPPYICRLSPQVMDSLEGLGSVALLEEVCCWRVGFHVSKAHAKPRLSACFQLLLQPHVFLPGCCHIPCYDDNGLAF